VSRLRRFLGIRDIEYVALRAALPHSSVVLASPVSDEEVWPMVIQGPEHQINFLHPLLVKMQKLSPFLSHGEGWVGVNHESATKLNLFYVYGDKKPVLSDPKEEKSKKIELLISKFRYDAAKYANLRFAEISVIEVVWNGDVALSGRISLPTGFENGTIILPEIWLH
jgi:hypothetical protein